jgi:hypothetical protein
MKLFNIKDTAMILIDHQVGTNTWASTTPLHLLQRNVIILAKFAKMAWRRMERAGVDLTSTNAMVAELVKNWASPAGAIAFPLLT